MKMIFSILILVSALLIVGGILVLSLGRRDRRRRLAAQKPPKAAPALENGNTISLSLAENEADRSAATPQADETVATADPMAVLETALRMGPAIMSVARIHAEDEAETAAKQRQALLFLQGAEALCTLEYALKKWGAAKTAEKRTALYNEIKDCTASIDTEAVRAACKATFDAMYPSFSEKLRQSAPDLSEAELRLCIFLALGQSTKDMALLTRRSVRTIETTIYHLRKKLGIPTEEKTSDFLKKYLF